VGKPNMHPLDWTRMLLPMNMQFSAPPCHGCNRPSHAPGPGGTESPAAHAACSLPAVCAAVASCDLGGGMYHCRSRRRGRKEWGARAQRGHRRNSAVPHQAHNINRILIVFESNRHLDVIVVLMKKIKILSVVLSLPIEAAVL
jgi:hypothetical protein